VNTKRLFLSALLGLILIGLLIAANVWVFQTALGLDYLRWFLKAGSVINLGYAFITLAWGDLNKVKGLVSAHPMLYIAAALYLVALPIQVLSTILRRPANPPRPRPPTRSELAPWSTVWQTAQNGMDAFDALLTSLFAILFTIFALAWLLVIAPAQYFVYLICAAPARLMRRSKRRVIAHFDEAENFHFGEVSAGQLVPEGWFEAGFFARPVSLTASFAAVLLWLLAQVIT
jgi:hypothetical protein